MGHEETKARTVPRVQEVYETLVYRLRAFHEEKEGNSRLHQDNARV